MKKEKIIQLILSDTGQIIALTNKGRMLCQYQEQIKKEDSNIFTYTGKWFFIPNPISDKKLLLKE